jgi:hypothetical protein
LVSQAEDAAKAAEEVQAAKAAAVKDKEAVRAAKRNLKKYCDKQEGENAFPSWKSDEVQVRSRRSVVATMRSYQLTR